MPIASRFPSDASNPSVRSNRSSSASSGKLWNSGHAPLKAFSAESIDHRMSIQYFQIT